MNRSSHRRLSAGSIVAAVALMCTAGIASATTPPSEPMGTEPMTQPKLSVTPSSLPQETMTVLLESRGKQA